MNNNEFVAISRKMEVKILGNPNVNRSTHDFEICGVAIATFAHKWLRTISIIIVNNDS
jgi:hypothetical protein